MEFSKNPFYRTLQFALFQKMGLDPVAMEKHRQAMELQGAKLKQSHESHLMKMMKEQHSMAKDMREMGKERRDPRMIEQANRMTEEVFGFQRGSLSPKSTRFETKEQAEASKMGKGLQRIEEKTEKGTLHDPEETYYVSTTLPWTSEEEELAEQRRVLYERNPAIWDSYFVKEFSDKAAAGRDMWLMGRDLEISDPERNNARRQHELRVAFADTDFVKDLVNRYGTKEQLAWAKQEYLTTGKWPSPWLQLGDYAKKVQQLGHEYNAGRRTEEEVNRAMEIAVSEEYGPGWKIIGSPDKDGRYTMQDRTGNLKILPGVGDINECKRDTWERQQGAMGAFMGGFRVKTPGGLFLKWNELRGQQDEVEAMLKIHGKDPQIVPMLIKRRQDWAAQKKKFLARLQIQPVVIRGEKQWEGLTFDSQPIPWNDNYEFDRHLDPEAIDNYNFYVGRNPNLRALYQLVADKSGIGRDVASQTGDMLGLVHDIIGEKSGGDNTKARLLRDSLLNTITGWTQLRKVRGKIEAFRGEEGKYGRQLLLKPKWRKLWNAKSIEEVIMILDEARSLGEGK